MGIEQKSNSWKIINSWWIVFSFVVFLNWMALLLAGVMAKKKQWMLAAALYFVPVFFVFYVSGGPDTGSGNYSTFENVVFSAFFLGWMGSILHSFLIRKEFLFLYAQIQDEGYDEFRATTHSKVSVAKSSTSQSGVSSYSAKHQSVLNKVLDLQNDILGMLEDIKKSDIYLVDELKPMVENYVRKTQELIEQDEALNEHTSGMSVDELNKKIGELTHKLSKTTNPQLKSQYQKNIEKLSQQRKALTEIQEMSDLKLELAVSSLAQIKLDLLKYHGLNDETKRSEFFENMATKSTELNEYVRLLRETKNEFSV